MKSIKGITLISLVITVIVLIILSSVGIYLSLGENGIFKKAEYAKNETTKQTATEKMNLKITNMQMETYAEEQRMPTLQEFADGLCVDNEIEYVELESKNLAALDKIEVGDASSIFTKLKEYPYEFEINSSLQLASIDGIKVATNNSQGGIVMEELLPARKIVLTTTTSTDINEDITINKSIENYKLLLVSYGLYNDTLAENTISDTEIILVEEIKYNNTNDYSKGRYYCLNSAGGPNYSYACIHFKNSNTIHISHTAASNTGRTKFSITSIKGIK